MPDTWTPTSWLHYPYSQAASYPEASRLDRVVCQLKQKKALVPYHQINQLRTLLAKARHGQAFILQGGDCAESFNNCRPAIIHAQLNLILSMANQLSPHLDGPIVPIGRMAGQYAKPRSSSFEEQQGVILPSYRGDLINAAQFNAQARVPNPERLLQGYRSAAVTLNFIRKKIKKVPFYTSHEALHLHYESALTRRCAQGHWYNFSTHLPWLGIRTSQLDSAHVEYLRGITNPLGIKIGPDATPDWLINLMNRLNPQREEGRVLLITRLGVQQVEDLLPTLIQATQKHHHPVTWACDPMHGNNQLTASGIKTRHMENIWQELSLTFKIHQIHQSHLGGLHLEMTPDAVTECLGGEAPISEADLKTAYRSLLDPRLNQQQALELITKFTSLIFKNKICRTDHT